MSADKEADSSLEIHPHSEFMHALRGEGAV